MTLILSFVEAVVLRSAALLRSDGTPPQLAFAAAARFTAKGCLRARR